CVCRRAPRHHPPGGLAPRLLLSAARTDTGPPLHGLRRRDPPRAARRLPDRACVRAALGAPAPGPRVDGAGPAHVIGRRGVSKRFGAHQALDGVSLAVQPHTTHVLLGGSGSGKSTVLRLVLGLVAADAGEVSVDGVPVGPTTRSDIQRRIGYVVQEGALYPH